MADAVLGLLDKNNLFHLHNSCELGVIILPILQRRKRDTASIGKESGGRQNGVGSIFNVPGSTYLSIWLKVTSFVFLETGSKKKKEKEEEKMTTQVGSTPVIPVGQEVKVIG